MFRKSLPPVPPPPDPASYEARLRALGLLLDRRGYAAHGLCVLAVDDGFVISGLLARPGEPAFAASAQTDTITAADLVAVMATW